MPPKKGSRKHFGRTLAPMEDLPSMYALTADGKTSIHESLMNRKRVLSLADVQEVASPVATPKKAAPKKKAVAKKKATKPKKRAKKKARRGG